MSHSLFQPSSKGAPAPLASPEMRTLIERFDWGATAVGPIESWPESLRSATRLILASAVPMVMLMGRDGIMVYNDAYSAFAGKRHPHLLGSPVLEGWREVADFNRRVLEAGFRGETLAFENQELTLHRNGVPERVWMNLDYSPVLGESGEPEGVLAIVIETTARMTAERALAQSEERLGFALDAAGTVGTWNWRVREDVVTADARFATMYGVDPEKARRGAPIAEFIQGIHPDDRPGVAEGIRAALAENGPLRAEYRLTGAPGGERWVLAVGRAIPGPDGRASRLPGVTVDITERKRVEEALAASEARFRAIADTMPQMVWSALPDGFHDYYNARWYEFTGVQPGTTDGEGWNGVFHPDDQERAWERWHHCLETGDPYEIEYRLRHHSGEYRWTLGRAVAIRDERGRITRWFGTCTDIHDAKLAAEEREVVAQELSHRIKNIFSVLNGVIALSARSYPAAKPFADQLKHRIFAMGQAHDFVRPHSAASRPSEKQTSLKALAERLLSPFSRPESENIRFTGEDAVIDEAAATPLALIFHELATNAAKYGALAAGGGTVSITGRRDGENYLLEWKERGGAPVREPEREGFGSRLMALSVEGQLGGSAKRFWESDGLRIEVMVPRAALRRPARLHRPSAGETLRRPA